jgi:hypothetical protein
MNQEWILKMFTGSWVYEYVMKQEWIQKMFTGSWEYKVMNQEWIQLCGVHIC